MQKKTSEFMNSEKLQTQELLAAIAFLSNMDQKWF